MIRAGRSCVRGLLITMLLAGWSTPIVAQEATAPGIVESRRRLDTLQRQRAELANEMTRIRSRVSDLSEELTNVEQQVSSSAAAIREIDFQIAEWQDQITRNSAELVATRSQLAERRNVLDRRIRSIYMRGRLQTLQVLLAAESFSDLLNRYRYLDLVARSDRRLMEDVAELERLLVARERALEDNVRELERVRGVREVEHSELTGLQAHQGVVLSEARSQEDSTADRIEDIERDEASLATMVAGFETRSRDPAPTSAAAPFASLRGSLPWPIDGPIVYPAGQPVAGASGSAPAPERSGIGIGGSAGEMVRAVAPGTVALSGPFEGYGPTVIISHGAGYYTLYLYLRDVTVRSGAVVTAGQTVGTIGQRTAQGALLEFQLRTPGGGVADPLEWLRPR